MVESKKTKLSSGKKSFNQHKINIISFNEEKTLKRTKKTYNRMRTLQALALQWV